jgi:methyl-accepting chemotaxis protein
MNWLSSHLFNLDPLIQFIFFGILVVGLLAYWGWARPQLTKTQRRLEQQAHDLRQLTVAPAPGSKLNLDRSQDDALEQAWVATQARILVVGQGDQARHLLLGSIEDLWRTERLLQDRLNLALFEAAPNIAVGVGLLFTFFFLTLALTDATSALAAHSENTNILDAARSLLGSAGGKFLSSLAGLLVSIVWTVAGRRRMTSLHRASTGVIAEIERLWPPIGAEHAVAEQLTQLQSMQSHLSIQQATLSETQAVLKDQQALTEDLLEQAREQTGALKRFETDLAVTIGQTITNSFSPQMEHMTNRLVDALGHLSDRIGTMNEDALRKMMAEFSQAIQTNTAGEMQQFKDSLTTLAVSLKDASQDLQTGVGTAATALDQMTSQMTLRLDKAAQNMSTQVTTAAAQLVQTIQGVDTAIDKARLSVEAVDTTLTRAAQLGQWGLARMSEALGNTEKVVLRIGAVGEQWSQTAGHMERTSGKLADVCDGVKDLAQEQKAVVQAVRSATPEALAAVNRMTQLLQDTTRTAADSLSTVQGSMERTSRDLGGVVTSITDGVVRYTQQIAQLHQTMDAEMAKAVGKLGGVIQNLSENIEDLNEGLDAHAQRS